MANVVLGFVPFLGYHHVLMILIMVAIILLCELTPFSPHKTQCTN